MKVKLKKSEWNKIKGIISDRCLSIKQMVNLNCEPIMVNMVSELLIENILEALEYSIELEDGDE